VSTEAVRLKIDWNGQWRSDKVGLSGICRVTVDPTLTMINQSNRKAIDIVGAPTLSGVAANPTFRLDGFGGDF
jgi:hypothetical protein